MSESSSDSLQKLDMYDHFLFDSATRVSSYQFLTRLSDPEDYQVFSSFLSAQEKYVDSSHAIQPWMEWLMLNLHRKTQLQIPYEYLSKISHLFTKNSVPCTDINSVSLSLHPRAIHLIYRPSKTLVRMESTSFWLVLILLLFSLVTPIPLVSDLI